MSTQTSSNNKRIAKNTLFLYLRMFFSMAVSLYTSRVVLNTLGVVDYGIWNVVGGVIAMFSFLTAAMSTASSRFLSYEIGEKDSGNVQAVFSATLTLHLSIALCILILGETVGLWFVENKLVIPEERMNAALIVYQTTIVMSMIGVMQVPYSASLMSYERMDVYAYIEMLHVMLKLAAVIALTFFTYDHLVTYSLLTLSISIAIILIYCLYCKRAFNSCRFILSKKWHRIKPMVTFSGWDLYGNMAVMARTQGVNMLLNIFFTTVMNAASGVATQVQGAVMSFASNVLTAIRPQIIKSYATGDNVRMNMLISKASFFTTLLLLLFTIPLCVETDYILRLWLKNPPEYAGVFIRYVLLFNLIANVSSVVVTGIHATGKIKRSSFINGTLYLLVIPISYFSFKTGGEPYLAYLINVIAVCGGLSQNIYCLYKFVPQFKVRLFIKNVLLRCAILGVVSYLAALYISTILPPSFTRLTLTTFVGWLIIVWVTYSFFMEPNEKNFVINKIKSIINYS